MTRLERETLARIRERLAIFDPGAAEKLAADPYANAATADGDTMVTRSDSLG